MSRFFYLSYYFSPLPESNFQYSKATLAFCVVLVLASLGLHIYRKKYLKDDIAKRILRPYPQLIATYGVIGLFLLFFRETNLPYLSMRIWWIVLLAFMLYSFMKFVVTYKSKYNSKQSMSSKAKTINKYLPKKKR